MRSILAILAALGLAAVAVMSFINQQWLAGTAFLAGALAIVLPALVGQGLGDVGDADLMVRFVRNPFGTIVDETVDRLTEPNEQRSPAAPTPQQPQPTETFDVNAAFARYMERRGEEQSIADPSSAPESIPTVRTFGRKGL